MVFRTRGLLVRQRTQTVNAIRGAEFGLVAPRGVANIEQLWERSPSAPSQLVVSTTAVLFERVTS